MSLLAKDEHVLALLMDDNAQRHLVQLSDDIERIACCDLHKAALAIIVYGGLLRTLRWPQEKCEEVVSLLNKHLDEISDEVMQNKH